ncbi:MAG: hypothetical protein WD544_00560 [Patescibacteria group bacterium]
MKDFFTSRFQTITDYFSAQSFAIKNVGQYFSGDFWTESGLPAHSQYTALSLIIIAAVITGLIIWRRILKKRHAVTPVHSWSLNQLTNVIIFVVMVTLSYWFFRSQSLAYLSSRTVILLGIITVLLWIAWVIFRIIRTESSNRVAYLEKERFFRYLPKSKKTNI